MAACSSSVRLQAAICSAGCDASAIVAGVTVVNIRVCAVNAAQSLGGVDSQFVAGSEIEIIFACKEADCATGTFDGILQFLAFTPEVDPATGNPIGVVFTQSGSAQGRISLALSTVRPCGHLTMVLCEA